MTWLGWSEFFYRLFASAWLPGRGLTWEIGYQVTAYPTSYWVAYTPMPYDGILLDFIVLIVVLLLVDWILKALRRYH